MKQKSLAYLLIIAFGVLLAPRSFWHECEDHHSAHFSTELSDHEHSDSHGVHVEKKCYACDYDMNAAEEPVSFSANFFAAFYPKLKEVKIEIRAVESVRSLLLRGPPTI